MKIKGSAQRVLLCICDGMGFSDNKIKNAVKDANTPFLDNALNTYPNTTIEPGGVSVGLPKGVAGNSEVGHMNLGAGRPVRQDLVRINEAIANNSLKDMEQFQKLINHAKNGSKKIHLMGLLSDGGVHSHIDHLKAILKILSEYSDIKVFFHAFMDGRDTPKTNGIKYLKDLISNPNFRLGSMQGRSIGMDRDRRWEKIENAYSMMTGKQGVEGKDPVEYIESQYSQELFDEFINPALFSKDAVIASEDSVFFINFRPDRAKQISTAFCDPKFSFFENKIRPSFFLCMSPYIDEEFPEVPILFNREKIKGTLSELLSSKKLNQLKIAETEKYAHVTYFFNGGEEKPFPGEDRILVNSPKDVATYDLKPQMSAPEVLEKLIAEIDKNKHTVYIVNFANPDMVGHTGNYEAAIKAMETIDHCLETLAKKCTDLGMSMLITADHGNCDQMVYEDGTPHTSHSNARVPFILIQKGLENKASTISIRNDGALKDVAPTILELLNIDKNEFMTGTSVFS